MSLRAMTWAMDQAPSSLSPTERFVLLVLADHVDDETGEAWPSIARLMRRTGFGRSTVKRALGSLETAGIIARVIQGADQARGAEFERPNLYRWTPPVQSGPGSSVDRPPVQSGPPPRSAADPYPSLGTLSEPSGGRRRATCVPDDFLVTADLREWAREQGVTVDLDAETRQFLDYHRARGSTMKDWTAAWRTWMRNTKRFGSRSLRADDGPDEEWTAR